MRTPMFAGLVIVSVLSCCGIAPAHAASTTVRVVRHGEDVLIVNTERVAGVLMALVASCSVNSTANLPRESWQTIATSDSFVHVVFPKSRRATVQANTNRRDARMIHEILLPLPEGSWPEYILIKTERGTIALAKYDDLAMREVILERQLDLRSVDPYKSLLDTTHEK